MTKKDRILRFRQIRREKFAKVMTAALVDDNMGAGVQLTGVTGSGKSNLGEWLFHRMVKCGLPSMYFDPHGTSARKVLRMCQDLPSRLKKTVWYIRVADPQCTAAINPLFVPRNNCTDYEWESAVHVCVERTAQIIFSVFGETQFGARPVLRKWLTRWLSALARSNMTLADAMLLIDPRNPIYELMLEIVDDDLARSQMEALAGMKVSDLEAEIGSARNRILAALEHPTAQTLFSRRDSLLDMQYVYDHDISLIVDFDKSYRGRQVLTTDVQQLICNLYLNQYLAAVMSTPDEERRSRLCFIDELPLFESSAPLLTEMCTEIRKFRTKFVFLHQGSARFPGRHDNEFLNTLSDMCRVHVFFRHGAGDARFFGDKVMLATWDSNHVKHVQRSPQQFTEGHDLVELEDHTDGTSEATATGTTDGTTDQITDTLTTAVSNAESRPQPATVPNKVSQTPSTTNTHSDSSARGHAQGTQHSVTETTTATRSASRTIKQQLVPRIVTRNIVTGIQFYTPEEIDRDIAARIAGFDTGEAILQIDGLATYLTKTPLAIDTYARTPKFAARIIQQFLAVLQQRPEFASPAHIRRERAEFLSRLAHELRSIAQARQESLTHHPSQLDRPPASVEQPVENPLLDI